VTEPNRDEAKRLRERGEYAGALAHFAPLWERDRQPWDGWGTALCLRRLGRHEDAIDVCRAVLKAHPDHHATRGIAAWCLRDRIPHGNPDLTTVMATIDSIERVLSPTPDGLYGHPSAFVRAVLDASKRLETAARWDSSADLLLRLDADRLDRKPGRSGDIEFQSEFEQWANRLTKSLDRAHRWDELVAATTTALKAGIRFHDGQERWVRYRQAKALHHLGRNDEAWEALGRCGQDHVAIDALKADVLVALGEEEKALALYARALLAATDLGPMVNVLDRVADLLPAEDSDADRHRQLARAVRSEKGWPIAEGPSVPLHSEPIEELRSLLTNTWQRWLPTTARVGGVITALLPNGFAGFIRGDDGHDYYFPVKELRGDGAVGAPVEFEPYERWDAKKERMSPAARKVTLA
jgi:tetratricopeptide (TPR) repeat protein